MGLKVLPVWYNRATVYRGTSFEIADHRGLVPPQRNARDVVSRSRERTCFFARTLRWIARDATYFAGMRYNGSSAAPQWTNWRSRFLEGTSRTGADPTWIRRTPSRYSGFIYLSTPLIFRSGSDSARSQGSRITFGAFELSVSSRSRCQRDETWRVLFVEKECGLYLRRTKNSSDQLMMNRR